MPKILVAEDEIAINKMLCLHLEMAGYQVVPFYDGQQVLNYLGEQGKADLALIDVMMPKADGFALLEPLKQHNIPIIYLTALGDLESKLTGLTGGAEDYIVKPFEVLELLVRIDKVLKRTGRANTNIRIDDIVIDLPGRTVQKGESFLKLTPTEYDLLLILAQNCNTAMSREHLLHEIWGPEFEGESRTVDVHIAQLRRKTGLAIVTVPKIGYRLEAAKQCM